MVHIKKKLTTLAGAALLCAATSTAFAQFGGDAVTLEKVFKLIDKNGDGVLQLDEVKAGAREGMAAGTQDGLSQYMLILASPGIAWGGPTMLSGSPPPVVFTSPGIAWGGPTMIASPPPPPPGEIPEPPPCSEALRTSEQSPQKTNVPCNGKEGNLLFRTVCNAAGYDQQAITLQAGRAAGCFGVEAITHNKVAWGIRVEGGAEVYRSDKPAPLSGLILTDTVPSATGKYTVFMDMAASDPGARVTVRFVDYSK